MLQSQSKQNKNCPLSARGRDTGENRYRKSMIHWPVSDSSWPCTGNWHRILVRVSLSLAWHWKCRSDWQNETKDESFVTCFTDAGGPDYDHEELLCTVGDLIGAGMETTTTFIRWAIVLLTNHVSVQERLHAEIDSVIGRQRPPTMDDRSKLVDKNTI